MSEKMFASLRTNLQRRSGFAARKTGAYLLFPLLLLLAVSPQAADARTELAIAGAENAKKTFLWIHFGEQRRHWDGALSQRYHIRSQPAGFVTKHCSSVRGFYRPGDRRALGTQAYPVPIQCQGEDCFFDIHCKGSMFVELTVQAQCGPAILSGRTVHSLYARRSAAPLPPVGQSMEDVPPRPGLHLRHASRHYYLQTGETYLLDYDGPSTPDAMRQGASGPNILLASADGAIVGQACVLSPQGFCRYIPAHDPQLDRQGSRAAKEEILLVRDSAGDRDYASTFTMYLHRSRYAHMDLGAGLLFFTLSAALILVLILLKKKHPWYH